MYVFNFSLLFDYLPALLQGLGVTLKITVLVFIAGTGGGLILAFMRFSSVSILKYLALSISSIGVSLPLMVVIFWLYYALPLLVGFSLPAFETSIIALSLNLAAFSSDIFVSSYRAVPRSQIETGIVSNFTQWQILRYITVPHVMKVLLGPLTGRYVETIKLTSLASLISVNELLHIGQNIISLTYRPIEVYTIIACLYLVIIVPCIVCLKYIEKKYAL